MTETKTTTRWGTKFLCAACQQELTEQQRYNNRGRCPHCGIKDSGPGITIVKSVAVPVRITTQAPVTPVGFWAGLWAALCTLCGDGAPVETEEIVREQDTGPCVVVQLDSSLDMDHRQVQSMMFPTSDQADDYVVEIALKRTTWTEEEIRRELFSSGLIQEDHFCICCTRPTIAK